MLEKEFEYYLKNQEELVKQYNGKFIVIKGEEVVKVFDTEIEAYNWAKEEYEPGTFLIQKVSPGDKDYTQTFHSRVRFA